MKVALRMVCLLAVLVLLPCAFGADLGGTWKGAFPFDGNQVHLTFHLKDADGAVMGTVDGLPTSPAEIHDGKVQGDTVTFWVNTDYQGQTYKLIYTGKIAADKIDFSFGTDDGSWSAEMTATRSDETTTPAAAGSN